MQDLLNQLRGFAEMSAGVIKKAISAMEQQIVAGSERVQRENQALQLSLQSAQSELARIKVYDEAVLQLQQYTDELREHGGASSIVDAVMRFPVTEPEARSILRAIRERVDGFIAENPAWRPVAKTLFSRLVKRVQVGFSAPKVNKCPAIGFHDIMDFIKSYGFSIPDDGPLAAALLRARADAGITQKRAAQEIGVKEGTYQNWECGKNVPKEDKVLGIAKFLGKTETGVWNLMEMQRLFCGSSEEISRCGRPTVQIDSEAFLRLYGKGLADQAVAEALGVSRSAVVRFREHLGLDPNKKKGRRGPGKPREKFAEIRRSAARKSPGRAQDPSRLAELRQRAGLTLKDMEKMLSVSYSTAWKLENGLVVRDAIALEQAWLKHLGGLDSLPDIPAQEIATEKGDVVCAN